MRIYRTHLGCCGLVPAEVPSHRRILQTDTEIVRSYTVCVHMNNKLQRTDKSNAKVQQLSEPAQKAQVLWSTIVTPKNSGGLMLSQIQQREHPQ